MTTRERIIEEIYTLAKKLRQSNKLQGLKYVSLLCFDYTKKSKLGLIKLRKELQEMERT